MIENLKEYIKYIKVLPGLYDLIKSYENGSKCLLSRKIKYNFKNRRF